MSCIEIDKAKKESLVDSEKELRLIRESEFISYGEISRDKKKRMAMCRPYFFKFVGEGKNYKFKKMETPMDYLEQIIDKEIPRSEDNINCIDLIEILIDGNNHNSDRKQIQNIFDKIIKINNEINGVWASNMKYDDKVKYTCMKREYIASIISKFKITNETMSTILYRLNESFSNQNGDIKKSGLFLLNVLFASHKEQFLNLFKKENNSIEVLIEIEDENIENKLKIYQKTYKKSTK